MLSQQGRQGQQRPGHLSKSCNKIKNTIAIARQGQNIKKKFILNIEPVGELNSHINANPDANVRTRLIHVKQRETPIFWWQLLQLLPQTVDVVDIIGPIVQIENIGVRMMGGNLIIVFTVPFKPMDIINTPSA